MINLKQDNHGVYEVFPLIYTPLWKKTYFMYTIFFILGTIFCVLIIYFYFIFKKNKKTKTVSLQENICISLEKLKKSIDKNDSKPSEIRFFYETLSTIFKNFLTDTHDFQMYFLTEVELIEHCSTCIICCRFFFDGCSQCIKIKSENNSLIYVDNKYLLAGYKKHVHEEIIELINRMYTVKYSSTTITRDILEKDLKNIISLITKTYNKQLK